MLSDADFMGMLSPPAAAAARLLVEDERMRPVWEQLREAATNRDQYVNGEGWSRAFAVCCALSYDRSLRAQPWDEMTQREREAWLHSLDRHLAAIIDLIKVGPVQAQGLPFKVLRSVLHSLDVPLRHTLPDGKVVNDVPGAPEFTAVQAVSEANIWSLKDALLEYHGACFRAAQIPQEIKKPRDGKSPRARFVLDLRDHLVSSFGDPMKNVLATVASVMFDDEAITVRLVHRITTGK